MHETVKRHDISRLGKDTIPAGRTRRQTAPKTALRYDIEGLYGKRRVKKPCFTLVAGDGAAFNPDFFHNGY